METSDKKEKNTHHGHAVKRFRHTLGIKQDVLAAELGISQASVSAYESRKVIEDDMIEKFANALGVAPQIIKDLEEDPVTVIIENNSIETNNGRGYVGVDNSTNNYDPIDKVVELCQKLLEKEQEKITLLEKLLKEK